MNAWYKEWWTIAIGIVIIITIITLHATTPKSTKEFSFKDTYWGMSKAQVMASETETFLELTPLYDNDECLEYKTETAKLYYYFTEDKLTHVLYVLGPLYYNKDDFKDYALRLQYHFEGYKEIFDRKYGPQTGGSGKNLDTRGHTVHVATWETHNTNIELIVSGGIHNLYLVTRFKNKADI